MTRFPIYVPQYYRQAAICELFRWQVVVKNKNKSRHQFVMSANNMRCLPCNNLVSSRNNRYSRQAREPCTSRGICLHFFPSSAVRGVHVSRVVPHLFTGRWLAYDWLPSLNTSTGSSVETLTFKWQIIHSQFYIELEQVNSSKADRYNARPLSQPWIKLHL